MAWLPLENKLVLNFNLDSHLMYECFIRHESREHDNTETSISLPSEVCDLKQIPEITCIVRDVKSKGRDQLLIF